jgi:hypothetical protein
MKPERPRYTAFHLLALFALLFSFAAGIAPAHATSVAPAPAASHTAEPASVTLVGSLQSELGCPGDWDPSCAASKLTYDADDLAWQGTWNVPAGSYEYKAALNGSWDENYGQNAQPGGANIPLNLAAGAAVKFYYSHDTHWITDNVNSTIATVPGSFQSELGCAGDWDPGCLRSWLQDPDGDGTYTFETSAIPPGAYEGKVAIDEGWDLNYGAGGEQNGANIAFNVAAPGSVVTFSWNSTSKVLTISVQGAHGPEQRRMGRPAPRLARPALPHPGRRGPGARRSPCACAPSTTMSPRVRLRVFEPERQRPETVPMTLGRGCLLLRPRPGDPSPATSGKPRCRTKRRTTCGTASSSPTAPDTDYYADNTPALDGGLGAERGAVDHSYALMVYDPDFNAPEWVSERRHLPDLPRPLPQRARANDPKDR